MSENEQNTKKEIKFSKKKNRKRRLQREKKSEKMFMGCIRFDDGNCTCEK